MENNRKLKILYHHRTQGRGAEGVHIREIIRALEKEGHKVYVVNPPGIDVLKENCAAEISSKPRLSSLWSFLSKHIPQICFELIEICYNVFAFYSINRIVKKEKIDFIYERNAFFCWAGTLVAKKNKTPIFIEINEVSGIERIRGQVLTLIAKKIEKYNFSNAYAIIVVSNFLKMHIANMGVEPKKIHVMPNAVDIEKFQVDLINPNNIINKFHLRNKLVLGFVGGFVKWHNFDFLFSVFNDLVNKSKQEITLFLLGDGSLRQELEKCVKNQGLESKVIFAGSVSHCDVPSHIKIMDICIIPHANEYRSPIKLFEYMAMGKPVVAPRVEPIESIINHAENGWIFDLENRESFLDALSFLVENVDIREKIGKNARTLVVNNYLWANNAKKLIKIYYGKMFDSDIK